MATNQAAGNSLDLVNIKEIRDNTIILKDGGMKQIVMVGGVNFALKSEEEQNLMVQGYQTFLNGIDFPLQVVVHSRKVNVDKYIETLLERKQSEESPLLRNQIDEYVEFVKGFVEKNAIMEKSFLVVVPFYPTMGLPSGSSLTRFLPFGKKSKPDDAAKKSAEENERAFKENLAQLGQRVTQVVNGLLVVGLEATALENDALVELLYNFYNPQTVERKEIAVPNEH